MEFFLVFLAALLYYVCKSVLLFRNRLRGQVGFLRRVFRGDVADVLGVFRSAPGEFARLQAVLDEILEQHVDYRAHRHAEEHSYHAEQSAADEDRYKNPHRRQPGGIPEDPRREDISVHRLEYQHEYREPQRLHRVVSQQEKQRAGDSPDERSDVGNEVEHEHDRGNQQRIGKSHERGADKAEQRHNEGFDDLSDDGAEELLARLAADAEESLRLLNLEECEDQLLGLTDEHFLAGEKVDGYSKSDDDIFHRVQYCPYHSGDVSGNSHQFGGILLPYLADKVVEVVQGVSEELYHLGVVLKDIIEPVFGGSDVAVHVVEDGYQVFNQLRDHHDYYQGKNQYDEQHGQRERQRPCLSPGFFVFGRGQLPEHAFFYLHHEGIQQVCAEYSYYYRIHDGTEGRKLRHHGIKVEYHHHGYRADDHGAGSIDGDREIFSVPVDIHIFTPTILCNTHIIHHIRRKSQPRAAIAKNNKM